MKSTIGCRLTLHGFIKDGVPQQSTNVLILVSDGQLSCEPRSKSLVEIFGSHIHKLRIAAATAVNPTDLCRIVKRYAGALDRVSPFEIWSRIEYRTFDINQFERASIDGWELVDADVGNIHNHALFRRLVLVEDQNQELVHEAA